MDSRVPENIAFIQFQLHPNYSTTSTGIVGCCGVKFGCNRNMIKYIFLESGNIIDYHSRLDFCRPFYSLPTQASNKPCFFLPLLIITPSFNSTWISTPTEKGDFWRAIRTGSQPRKQQPRATIKRFCETSKLGQAAEWNGTKLWKEGRVASWQSGYSDGRFCRCLMAKVFVATAEEPAATVTKWREQLR